MQTREIARFHENEKLYNSFSYTLASVCLCFSKSKILKNSRGRKVVWVQVPSPAPKNPSLRTWIFLSKPQAWHIIDVRSTAYIIKGGLTPPLYLTTLQRVYYCGLMIYNSCGIDDIPQHVADDIQGFALIYLSKSGIILLKGVAICQKTIC